MDQESEFKRTRDRRKTSNIKLARISEHHFSYLLPHDVSGFIYRLQPVGALNPCRPASQPLPHRRPPFPTAGDHRQAAKPSPAVHFFKPSFTFGHEWLIQEPCCRPELLRRLSHVRLHSDRISALQIKTLAVRHPPHGHLLAIQAAAQPLSMLESMEKPAAIMTDQSFLPTAMATNFDLTARVSSYSKLLTAAVNGRRDVINHAHESFC